MALGPVMRLELITSSRRRRYYAARVAFGLFLLYSLSEEYAGNAALFGPLVTVRALRRFAEGVFLAFAWAQWATLLAVVPALVAGVIADAHRRKTLRDLLASGLSERSIVLGKFGARMVHVGVFVAAGLPVVALVGVYGGLDPTVVAWVYAATLSLALAVGGVSILASALARRPREAVLAAYTMEAGYLLLLPLLGSIVPYIAWPFSLADPVFRLLLEVHPLIVWNRLRQATDLRYYTFSNVAWVRRSWLDLEWQFLWMTVLQSAFGLVTLALAVWATRRLRGGDRVWSPTPTAAPDPVAASADAPERRRKPRRRLPDKVLWQRPPCGDAPMLWKECSASPRGGLAFLLGRPVVLLLGTLLACYLFDTARPAFRETLEALTGSSQRVAAAQTGRSALNVTLRDTALVAFTLWTVAVASAGALGVTSEREDDTWLSLTATLVTGPEVVWAKVLGAFWAGRWLGLAFLSLVVVGLLAGAVHPLGAAVALVGMAAFGGFAAALGVRLSMNAATSSRALLGTALGLLAVNLGPAWVLATTVGPEGGWLALMAPFAESSFLISYPEAWAVLAGETFRVADRPTRYTPATIAYGAASVALYGLAAWILVASASKAYDRAAGRARRPRPNRGGPAPPAAAGVSGAATR